MKLIRKESFEFLIEIDFHKPKIPKGCLSHSLEMRTAVGHYDIERCLVLLWLIYIVSMVATAFSNIN